MSSDLSKPAKCAMLRAEQRRKENAMFHFFAYVSRLKHIRRWGLMHCAVPENDAEHSLQVAMIAHALAVMARDRYGRDVNPEHVLALAVYHDAPEVFTGDMPTPVKYALPELRGAYASLESLAAQKLTAMLPEAMRSVYAAYLAEEDGDRALVKAADRISAYLKCLEERRAGNPEFEAAETQILQSIEALDLPEVRDFMAEFVPSFLLTLDELNRPGEVLP